MTKRPNPPVVKLVDPMPPDVLALIVIRGVIVAIPKTRDTE